MDALPWLLMPVFSVPRFFNNLGLLFIASRQRSSEILGEPCGGASRMYPAEDFRRLRDERCLWVPTRSVRPVSRQRLRSSRRAFIHPAATMALPFGVFGELFTEIEGEVRT